MSQLGRCGQVSKYKGRWVTIHKATPCTREPDGYPVTVRTSSVVSGRGQSPNGASGIMRLWSFRSKPSQPSKSQARKGFNPSYKFISGCLCCPYT